MNKYYNKTGVYKIQSEINGMIYIGGSLNIGKRWWKHKDNLKKSIHPNYKIQEHSNHYGLDDLKFSILEFCLKDQLIEMEQLYINIFKPQFNISKFVGSSLGLKRTDETKIKMRLSHINQIPWMKGKHHSEETINSIRESVTNIWKLKKQELYV